MKSRAEVTTRYAKAYVIALCSAAFCIASDLGKKGCGTFNLFGLAKMRTVAKPATKSRKGINPFTGQEQTFKAKPASRKVRIRAMKGLNEAV